MELLAISCLSKLERVKANSIEVFKIMGNYRIPPG